MELKDILNEVLKENNNFEQFIKEEIEKNIKKSISDALGNLLGYRYSTFSEKLKEVLSEKMSINFNEINLDQYNRVVMNEINKCVNKVINEDARLKIQDNVKKIIGQDLKEEYSFSELLELFKKEEIDEDEDKDVEEIYLEIEKSCIGYYIYLNKKQPRSKYASKYMLGLNEEGLLFRVETTEDSYKNTVFKYNEFANLLSNIYLQGKKIILDNGTDADDYDLEVESYREDY